MNSNISYEMSLLLYVVETSDTAIEEYYFTEDRLKFFTIVKEFNLEFNKLPLPDSVKELSLEKYKKDVSYLFEEIELYDVIDKEVLISKLKDAYTIRNLQAEINRFNDTSEENTLEAYETLISNLVTVQGDMHDIQGSLLHETAPDRMEDYLETKKSGKGMLGERTHIGFIDRYLSGAVGGKLHVFFSLPKVGKTNLLKEIAYNLAVYEDVDTMFFSGEMLRKEIDLIIHAREAMLDSMIIRNATLCKEDEDHYINTLKNIYERDDKLYIVDNLPDEFTVEDIIGEVMIYYKKFGRMPKVICIDYLNLMGTTKKGLTQLTQIIAQIAKDLKHKLAKKYNICVFTATQENRDGAKLKRLGKKRGQENVKDSHGITPHVNSLIHIDTPLGDVEEELKNKLLVSSEINRDGVSFEESLTYLKEYHYIGDEEFCIPKMKFVGRKEVRETANVEDQL